MKILVHCNMFTVHYSTLHLVKYKISEGAEQFGEPQSAGQRRGTSIRGDLKGNLARVRLHYCRSVREFTNALAYRLENYSL